MQHAEATVGLAEVWLSMGPQHALRALEQLHTVLPDVLAEGAGGLRATALRLQAECMLVSASHQDVSNRADE